MLLAGLWQAQRCVLRVGVAGGCVWGVCRTRTGGASALRAGGGGLPGVMAGPEGLAGLHWPPLPGASFRGVVGTRPTDSPTQTIELKVAFEALEIVSHLGPGLGTADLSLPIVRPSSLV